MIQYKNRNIDDRKFANNGDNSIWTTAERIKCDFCNRNQMSFSNYRVIVDDVLLEDFYLCNSCHIAKCKKLMYFFYAKCPEVNVLFCRGIEVVWTDGICTKKREPVGLAKRYQVLEKHRFKCASCGASASEKRIEIDHIIPVSNGGSSKAENLQPLCFDCNRGKGDK